MEVEDSRKALFTEPNAYIQNVKTKNETKKIVFSEPYESIPNFYINNNFKKGDCNCIPKQKEQKKECENKNCKQEQKSNFLSGLNFQSLMPLISMLMGGNGVDLTKILSSFSTKEKTTQNSLLSMIANPDVFNNISKMFFKPKDINKKTNTEIKSTDFEIENYTKVE